MLKLTSQLPEFPVVMAMYGVDDSLSPQLIAEIGDMTRFAHRSTITSFASVIPAQTSLEPTRPRVSEVQKQIT